MTIIIDSVERKGFVGPFADVRDKLVYGCEPKFDATTSVVLVFGRPTILATPFGAFIADVGETSVSVRPCLPVPSVGAST